ncbi:hypothetical protein BDF20DRAFT_917381 [Mycotypha africana]|uniref:uncharacterized protein n=1 Tax=Mycotypha africana TaxID=64632 RepID=UPI0022FFD0EE|nr:uncharacterized protein BDF20DRAFT_917381 [Mycotypha africana]KAI8967778.1 hypothetical protein BDF20DRAFT_917381 [Mycotypha africana]
MDSVKSDEYTDDDDYTDYCSEDDYEPIDISHCGDNTQPEGWASLRDPNFYVKANGLGSGSLHRQGTHYKPVPEEVILAQRLNKPMPGQPQQAQPELQQKKKKKKRKKPRVKVTTSIKNPLTLEQSNWANHSLATVPFWETPVPQTSHSSTPTLYDAGADTEESGQADTRRLASLTATPSTGWSTEKLSSEAFWLTKPAAQIAHLRTTSAPAAAAAAPTATPSVTPPRSNQHTLPRTLIDHPPCSVGTQTCFCPPRTLTTHSLPVIHIPPAELDLLTFFEAQSSPSASSIATHATLSTVTRTHPTAAILSGATRTAARVDPRAAGNVVPVLTLMDHGSPSRTPAPTYSFSASFNSLLDDPLDMPPGVKSREAGLQPPLTPLPSSTAQAPPPLPPPAPLKQQQQQQQQEAIPGRAQNRVLLRVKFELGAGVTALLDIEEDSDPWALANQLASQYHLDIADHVKKNIAATVARLKCQKLAELAAMSA